MKILKSIAAMFIMGITMVGFSMQTSNDGELTTILGQAIVIPALYVFCWERLIEWAKKDKDERA